MGTAAKLAIVVSVWASPNLLIVSLLVVRNMLANKRRRRPFGLLLPVAQPNRRLCHLKLY